MKHTLRCLEGPHQGRELRIEPDTPLQFDLKRQGQPCGMVSFAEMSEGIRFINDSELPSTVNDVEATEGTLTDGDRIRVGPLLLELFCDDETAPGMPPLSALSSDTEGSTQRSDGRTARRISASRMATVEPGEPETKGIFRKVGAVFRRHRDDRPEDLVDAEERRDQLLCECGRLALERQGGFGLAAGTLGRLIAGEAVTIHPADLDGSRLETFRRNRDLLAMLDAEIEAKRRAFGLPVRTERLPDPMPLREEREQRESNAFQAMDAAMTDELEAGGTGEVAGGADQPAPGDGDPAETAGYERRDSGSMPGPRRRQRRRRR